MTAEQYSDDEQLAMVRAERDRLEVVQELLWDMRFAAFDSQKRKGFAGPASVEDDKHAHCHAVSSSVQAELDEAATREHQLTFGRDSVGRRQARRIERSR